MIKPLQRKNDSVDRAWGMELCHPIPLVAVLMLAVNDHVLKGAGWLPGWFTGKLSDVAGLFYFPMLLVACTRGFFALCRQPLRIPTQLLATVAVLLTAIVFTAAKVCAVFNDWLCGIWGVFVMDRSDLWALPILLLSWFWLTRHRQGDVFA